MSNKNNKTGASSINQQEHDKQLWKRLKIYFRLESSVFPDNKIYGSFDIRPKEALRLIKNFTLVANDSSIGKINIHIRKISASGFDPTKTRLWVSIKAISKDNKFESKQSERQYFAIIRQRFPLTPTLHYHWPSSTNPNPSLVVRWFHMGDKIAEKYVLCLDGKEIQYIRQPSQYDVYQICIRNFQPGATHTLQLLGRLNNGKETYQSELEKISVPVKDINQNTEGIKVVEESDIPDDLQDLIDEDEENPEGETEIIEEPPSYKKMDTILSCGCTTPHKSFPGVKHYLNTNNGIQSPVVQRKRVVSHRKTTSHVQGNDEDTGNGYQNEERQTEHTDDDDDVVVTEDIFSDTS